ncbi:MAG: excinuclease ABC subunit UvrA, partial [Gammaproteobacteria bacterium]
KARATINYRRPLFARAGEPRCPRHDHPRMAQTVSQMVDAVLAMPEGERLMLLAPVVRARKGEHHLVLEQLRGSGFVRVRIDGRVHEIDDCPHLDKAKKHDIDVVVDRFKVRGDLGLRLAESFETALRLAEGLAVVASMDEAAKEQVFSARYACPECGHSIPALEPRLFSFNNPAVACQGCDGLGVQQFFDVARVVEHPESSLAQGAIRGWDRRNVYYFQLLTALANHYGFGVDTPFETLEPHHRDLVLRGSGEESIPVRYTNDRGDTIERRQRFEGVMNNLERRYKETESDAVREELSRYIGTRKCQDCAGSRLRSDARHVYVDGRTLPQVSALTVGDAHAYFSAFSLTGRRGQIADKILKELRARLGFLVNVGLDYLALDRSADTLSGGEAQRIRLASQIGAGLVGVMYILDEPSIGLHQRDNARLLATLTHLRDIGNSVIVVEHDEEAIRSADHLIDIGPGAGSHGGEVVAEGALADLMASSRSITGDYLAGRRRIALPMLRTPPDARRVITVRGARGNNLKDIDVTIPVGLFTCVTGVSGSGKSTLVNNTLYPVAATRLNGASTLEAAPCEGIEGLEHFDRCIDIDQSPIGRTPRSNP